MKKEKREIIKLSPETEGKPTYEVIKKEDLEAAFRDALIKALQVIIPKIDGYIEAASSGAPQGLWVWDYTSRWDIDMWA